MTARAASKWRLPQKLLEIRTDDLQVFNLVTGASPAGQRDVIVYKTALRQFFLFKGGDRITFTFNSAQEVEFIEAVPAADQLVFGQIASIDHTGKTVVTDNLHKQSKLTCQSNRHYR